MIHLCRAPQQCTTGFTEGRGTCVWQNGKNDDLKAKIESDDESKNQRQKHLKAKLKAETFLRRMYDVYRYTKSRPQKCFKAAALSSAAGRHWRHPRGDSCPRLPRFPSSGHLLNPLRIFAPDLLPSPP